MVMMLIMANSSIEVGSFAIHDLISACGTVLGFVLGNMTAKGFFGPWKNQYLIIAGWHIDYIKSDFMLTKIDMDRRVKALYGDDPGNYRSLYLGYSWRNLYNRHR